MCEFPIVLPIDTITKKMMKQVALGSVSFSRVSSLFPAKQRFLVLPCGKCDNCRLSHSKLWAFRCMCEYISLPDDVKDRCWFFTLTYDDMHNPIKLWKRDVQLFLKRLRKKYKDFKIKYFYCGEYGDLTLRPHYHMIIYNVPIDDLEKQSINFAGDVLYKSKIINGIWKNGFVSIGRLSLRSASYTARYTLKKSSKTDLFLSCSKGFGKNYFYQNMNEITSKNYVSIYNANSRTFCKSPIPKYFLKLYRKYLFNKNGNDNEYYDFLLWKKKQIDKYKEITFSYYPNIRRSLSEKDALMWIEQGAAYGISPEDYYFGLRKNEDFKKRIKMLICRGSV